MAGKGTGVIHLLAPLSTRWSGSPATHDDEGLDPLQLPATAIPSITAVGAAYPALIGMMLPFVEGAFGKVTVRSPFLKVAVTFDPSTVAGSRTVRTKAP